MKLKHISRRRLSGGQKFMGGSIAVSLFWHGRQPLLPTRKPVIVTNHVSCLEPLFSVFSNIRLTILIKLRHNLFSVSCQFILKIFMMVKEMLYVLGLKKFNGMAQFS